MARSVRDAKLDKPAARERLEVRGKPHFRLLDPGLHLGYRRLRGAPGRWVARFYVGEQRYAVKTLGTADDFSGANGVDVLSFQQAQAEARRRRDARVRAVAGRGPFTVADAIRLYIEALEHKGRKVVDTTYRANAMILPTLGRVVVDDLTTETIRAWVRKLVSTPPRARTGKGKAQRFRPHMPDDRETMRRRRNTANRITAILRAALTHAWREGKVSSDQAWRRVKLFENVSAARVRYLTVAEGKRLLNACDADFRDLARAALETGCRYGELGRIKVGDFNPGSGTVAILELKSGRSRHVVLTDQGVSFFSGLCAGRPGSELLLRRGSNGETWGPSNQTVPMNQACRRAGITPPVNFHALRHSYASLAVMNGAPLHVIGANLGHVDTRMVEKHYGHLAPSYVADQIRRHAPKFGFARSNVRQIGTPT